ncbi:hypothetical protein WG907_04525 [Sphingobium sp. AN558]|uniref:hypothetical protein n=1 Tax=Sphingobium sp. AN558 TaxID=3133442 RepID=UPI0030BA3290
MAAISDDTAALVAAQLTQAVMQARAQTQGIGGLSPTQMEAEVAAIYMRFRSAVAERDIRPAHDTAKIIE